jgi:hypothetical protein
MTTFYNTPATGGRSKVAFNIGGTIIPMEVLRSTLASKQPLISRNGIRGTRAHLATDSRLAGQHASGTLEMEPSPNELEALMPLILGFAGTSGNAAETVPTFIITEDKGGRGNAAGGAVGGDTNGDLWTYCGLTNGAPDKTVAGCKVTKATLSGTQGTAIKLALEVIAQCEVQGGTAINSVSSDNPFIFSDLSVVLPVPASEPGSDTLARQVHNFTLDIDNHIDAGRFLNSVYLLYLQEEDRTVGLQLGMPWTDANADLYPLPIAGIGTTSHSPVLTLTPAQGVDNTASTLTFGCLQTPNDGPEIPGKTEIMHSLKLVATSLANGGSFIADVAYSHAP